MNIVILGPAHPFRGGGITTFNERLARELQSQGHEVTIVNFTVQYPGFLFPGKSQFSEEPAPADLTIRRWLHSMNPLSWLSTGRKIRAMRPDLVIVRFWLPFMGPAFGTVLRQVKKNKATKVIAITDNIIPHEKRPGDLPFTRYFVGACDAFVCMSEKVLRDLRKFVQDERPVISVVHPLYDNFGSATSKDEALKALSIEDSGPLLLFFGFIRKYKGLDLLLQAMAKARTKGLRLLVAGEFYEDPQGYQQLIDSLGIREQLILHTDFIPSDAVKHYFSAADVVVQPYRNATQSGVTPLAYHFELPMIVTRVGALPDYVPEGVAGLVTDPDADAIAMAIDRYFDLGKSYFLPGLVEEKKQYSWELFAHSIISLAKQV